MDIQQKHFSTKIALDFGERELTYKIRDNSGEREFAVDYGRIPKQSRKVFDRNIWLRNAGLIWCVLGLAFMAWAAMEGGVTLGSAFWLIVGIGCLAVYRATWADYTVFDTPEGPIFVLEAADHDKAIAEIAARRKTVLQNWFRELDFAGDEDARRHAIDFMKKQGALTEAEAAALAREPDGKDTRKLIGPDTPPGRTVH